MFAAREGVRMRQVRGAAIFLAEALPFHLILPGVTSPVAPFAQSALV